MYTVIDFMYYGMRQLLGVVATISVVAGVVLLLVRNKVNTEFVPNAIMVIMVISGI